MRLLATLITIFIAVSSATAREYVPIYGPKNGAMGEGYKYSDQKDGSWRIVTEYHTRDPMVALNVALYRAADMAREAGKPYVQVLSGYGMSSYGVASGFVFARPSDNPAPPASCRTKRCYTADVAKVLEALGGETGNQPGMPKPTVDEHGRTVLISGYGVGAIAWTD